MISPISSFISPISPISPVSEFQNVKTRHNVRSAKLAVEEKSDHRWRWVFSYEIGVSRFVMPASFVFILSPPKTKISVFEHLLLAPL